MAMTLGFNSRRRLIALAVFDSPASTSLRSNPPDPDSNATEMQQMLATDIPDHRRANKISMSSTVDLLPPNPSIASFSTAWSNAETSRDDCEGHPTTPISSVLPTSSLIPPKSFTNEFSRTWTYWKWEVAACVLLLAVLAAMIATISPYENQPLPQWPFQITVNALLSLYILIFKSALAFVVTSCVGQLQWAWFSSAGRPLSDMALYDSAGRGPWGSIAMLFRKRPLQPLMGLGAVIMVLSVAIDPFVQQLIHNFDCSVPLSAESAILPRTNRLDRYSLQVSDTATFQHLQSSIFEGFSSSGFSVPWKCSTGNCTFFEVYTTLGLCSICQDLSTEIIVNTTMVDYDDAMSSQTYRNLTSTLPSGDGTYNEADNYQMRSGDPLRTRFQDVGSQLKEHSFSPDQSTDVASMNIWFPNVTKNSTTDLRTNLTTDFSIRILMGKTSFSDEKRLISTGEAITGCGTTKSNDSWTCRGYGAASCTLKPCVREYSASIEGGQLTERLISQSPDINWGLSYGSYRPYYGLMDTQCMSTQEQEFLRALGYRTDNISRWIPFESDPENFYEFEVDHLEGKWNWMETIRNMTDHGCLHLMDAEFIYQTVQGRWGRNSAYGQTRTSSFIGILRGVGWSLLNYGLEDTIVDFDGPQLLHAIYNYGSVDFQRVQSVFSNISDSITTFIRTNGNKGNSAPVRGQVEHSATCLGIQWPWLALPAVLAILAIECLILVVERTWRLEIPVWKASPLPWILSGAEKDGIGDPPSGQHESFKGSADLATMDEVSRHVMVTVSRGPTARIEMIQPHEYDPQGEDVAHE